LLPIATACGGDDASPGTGDLGQRCYPNLTCNAGLVCIAGTCAADVDGGVAGDAFVCPADPLEANDSTNVATDTAIDNAAQSAAYTATICPKGDRDTFRVSTSQPGRNIEFILESPYARSGS
jgi:hypothetical protein